MIFIDALRVTIIAFVIIHHAAQAYGPTGGFWPVHDQAQSDWFAPFYTVNSAFGLGLLFLLAGYFVPQSYERKGAWRFLREHWARLGAPLAIWIFLVQLPAIYLLRARPPLDQFVHLLYEQGWLPLYAHLWFVAHLLLYSTLYAAWRTFSGQGNASRHLLPPTGVTIAIAVIVLTLITWIVRIRYPVDKWAPLLWIMPAEPAHLPQYVALFIGGIAAYRGDWFYKLPKNAGMACLAIGLFISAAVYIAHLGGPLRELMATGGLNLSSLARSGWETTIAIALSLGLIVAFRELAIRSSRSLTAMVAASFGAYILHPPIVIALQAAILNVMLPALMKFVLVSALGIALSFGLAGLAGRVPGIRTALGAGERKF